MQKMDDGSSQNQKKVPNPANFKIVKCKNFEKGKHIFLTLRRAMQVW